MAKADRHTTPEPEPTSVYRYYDAHKILIYVGITRTATTRNQQHNQDKGWWPFVAEQVVEHLASRDLAHAREIELIRTFQPPFNTQHNPEHHDLRLAYIRLAQDGKLGLTVKRLAATGVKREISLHHIHARSRDWRCATVFLTHLEDAGIALALRHIGGVKVFAPPNHQHVGKVVGIERAPVAQVVAQIHTTVVLSRTEVIESAVARLRYVSLKAHTEVVELRNIELRLNAC